MGSPVDGPPRCTFTTTIGNSAITPRPKASALSAKPGPEVEVTASLPANEAPMVVHIPAISSSAWKLFTPRSFLSARACKISVAGVEGLGFAIPINDAKPVIDQLIMFGYVKGRPLIGISGKEVTEAIAQQYELPVGIYVLEVTPGSGADKAGIRKDDVLVSLADKDAKTMQDLNEIKKDFVLLEELRTKISQDTIASWRFLNFDRSPDSLFGDQVKTRNCIAIRTSGIPNKKVFTSGLHRWTSEARTELFTNIDETEITRDLIISGIPKVSSVLETSVFTQLLNKPDKLSMMLSTQKTEYFIAVNSTAYNWICVYDHIPPSVDGNGNSYTPTSMKRLYLSSDEDRYFVISVLSNRIAYWFWTVIGDGFHFNSQFLQQYGIHKKLLSSEIFNQLAVLGRDYCKQVQQFPTYSINCQIRIVNYDFMQALELVDKIELLITEGFSISKEFHAHIKNWYDDHINCGR